MIFTSKKEKAIQAELTRSYDKQRNGSLKEKIEEAYKNLEYDIDVLNARRFVDESIGHSEYMDYRMESMVDFIETVMKVVKHENTCSM